MNSIRGYYTDVKGKIIVVILFIPVIILLGSCGIPEEELNENICPDELVEVKEIVITDTIVDGEPKDSEAVFNPDVEVVHCVIRIPDICCSVLDVKWIYQDAILKEWHGIGLGDLVPMTFSLEAPTEGFSPGDYKVVLQLNDRILKEATFKIVE